jgi:hypothetical protein
MLREAGLVVRGNCEMRDALRGARLPGHEQWLHLPCD